MALCKTKFTFSKNVFITASTVNMIKSFFICRVLGLWEFYVIITCISGISLEKKALRSFYINNKPTQWKYLTKNIYEKILIALVIGEKQISAIVRYYFIFIEWL